MTSSRAVLSVFFVFCFSAAVLLQNANGANLLGLFISCSPSHLIVHMSEMKALAERGHNITVVTTLEPKVNHPAIRVIVVPPEPTKFAIFNEQVDRMAKRTNSVLTMLKDMVGSVSVMITMQYDVLADPRVKALYDSPAEKFDAVIWGYFMNEFALAVPAKLNLPIIVSWTGAPMAFLDRHVGSPSEVAYVPNINLPMQHGEIMNFQKRIQNYLMDKLFNLIIWYLDRSNEQLYKELIHDSTETLRSFKEMQKNISLVFVNHHFSEGPIRPNVPAIVEIGGIQIKEKPNKLPKDIDDFLNASKKHGAILFSLGSNIKSDNIQKHTIDTIYRALSNLKQNVIWKWDDLQNTPGNASNIIYKKWLPQDDILAHPNVKLFITHAGKGGIAESQYHAVPMIALPIFGDQIGNAKTMASAGYGIHLDVITLTENEFKNALLEVLENPVYAQNIKQFSQLYRDRPLTAKESVVFWTEYVIRNHGAAHMQSPLVHLNSFQSSSLDVIFFLLAVIYIVWRIIKLLVLLVIKIIRNKLSGKKNLKVKKQ